MNGKQMRPNLLDTNRKLRHVLCVYPYRNELGPHGRFYPPLGLEIIAGALRSYCEDIDVIDLRFESKRTREFLRADTDLVCFSVNWDLERDFVRSEICSVPGHVPTVVGGRHASEVPEDWLGECPNIDMLVRGDGEEFIRDLASGMPPPRIAGVSFRNNGSAIHNPVRRYGRVSDDLIPDRSLRRYVYSVDVPEFSTGITFDSMATSLGCPYNCKFCAQNLSPWGAKRAWSARSAESVVQELGQIDAEVVFFVDPNFTHDMNRVGRICDLVLERGIRKQYVANARLEAAKRPDVLRKMERAGFIGLGFGIESAQDKTLRSMGKGFTVDQVRSYCKILSQTKMLVHGNFIIGCLGETEEEMLQIGRYAHELGIDTISARLLVNERYSGLEKLVADRPNYHVGVEGDVYSDEYPPEKLSEIRDQVVSEFYTASQLLRVGRKALRHRLLRWRMLASVPGLLLAAAAGRFNPESDKYAGADRGDQLSELPPHHCGLDDLGADAVNAAAGSPRTGTHNETGADAPVAARRQ